MSNAPRALSQPIGEQALKEICEHAKICLRKKFLFIEALLSIGQSPAHLYPLSDARRKYFDITLGLIVNASNLITEGRIDEISYECSDETGADFLVLKSMGKEILTINSDLEVIDICI